ncbi:uncharacterized protein VP01_38g9 [Puccinia sorghi]|uniref:DUF8040 domain-containing protein n=1 Tax=Puccinia sorghi TaxID=27349 RepID=A0A0L6USQ1_9BASI|nr:uncharacterized protein VP01_38g9 [Puccinia sorghi]
MKPVDQLMLFFFLYLCLNVKGGDVGARIQAPSTLITFKSELVTHHNFSYCLSIPHPGSAIFIRKLILTNDRLRLAVKITIILILIASIYELSKITRNPYNDAKFTGSCYTNFLLNGNCPRCSAILWLNPATFKFLASTLAKLNENLVSTRLSMQEQLAIFIYILGQAATNQQAQDFFQHSGKTISRFFNHIIYLLLKLAPTYIKIYMAALWCNRKGTVSQNVLGVVDFDMCFTYIYARWEGLAHVIPGSYLKQKWRTRVCLCHTVASIITYANRGWLRQKSKNKEELFNLRHAMLCNLVKRMFGGWKKQFPILSHALETLDYQRDLVFALAVVHNFIIDHNGINGNEILSISMKETEDHNVDDSCGDHEDCYVEVHLAQASGREKWELKEWQDNIADEMWNKYQEVTGGDCTQRRNQHVGGRQSSRP